MSRRPRPTSVPSGILMHPAIDHNKDGQKKIFFCPSLLWSMAGCIKMPLGTEVGLGLRDIVLDVDPATPRKRAHPPYPIFGPCILWPNGWMDEDAAWYGSRTRPRPHCTRRGSTSCEEAQQPPLFGPCLLWPRSPISANAELLLCIIRPENDH